MKPFYSVNFNARMCNMKISINGIPLINMEVDGQCSTRYPFNNLILKSGLVSVKYEIRPLKGELQLHKRAYLSCEVELFDLDLEHEPMATMASYATPPQGEIALPYLVHEEAFRVDVPYSLTGWTQSTKLDQLKDQLRPMVFMKYNSIIAMMRNHHFPQYENTFRERANILGTCFYLSEEEKLGRLKEIEQDITNCTEIVSLSSKDDLELAAEGRLVRLIKADGESALRVKNDATGEEIMIELWLHMKPGSSELTII